MIIGISGYAGSGKDEVCSKIQQLDASSDWQRKKWSGKLKKIASLLTGIPVEKFEDQDFKKTDLGKEWSYNYPGEYYDDGAPVMIAMSVRGFLQKLGTEGLRYGLHENTWVNALMADYTPTNDCQQHSDGLYYTDEDGTNQVIPIYPNWIITDTRFPNEAQAIKDAGGIVIRVDRMHITPINEHYSESALDGWDFDYYIENSGTHQDLFDRVEEFLATIIK